MNPKARRGVLLNRMAMDALAGSYPGSFVSLEESLEREFEYDGARKIASLPYVLPISPQVSAHLSPDAALHFGSTRTGVRIPVALESKDSKYEYIDVGTNLDCRAQQMADGRYDLSITLERSSVYSQVAQNKAVEWAPGEERPGNLPLVRSFRTRFDVLVRDGQTVEGATATDPLSGHVLKVEVTLNTIK